MTLLVASLLALLAGPLLLWRAGPRPRMLAFGDGFVTIALGGLIALHLLPSSIAAAGPYAALAGVVGLVAPPLLERGLSSRSHPFHTTLLSVAMAGLALHSLLDGTALALNHAAEHHHHHESTELLALAVVLHQLPIGLAIWWLVGLEHSARRAIFLLAFIAMSTIAGYFGAAPLLALIPERSIGVFQALIAGLLLHTVFAHPPRFTDEAGGRPTLFATLGAMFAVGTLVFVGEGHPMAHGAGETLEASSAFMALAYESAPALLLAFAGAGLMPLLLTPASRRWLGGGTAFTRATRGMLFGLPLPVCSCGVLPVYRSMVTAGVPVPGAMAFLIATPEVGIAAVLITVPLLGGEMAITRVVSAAIVALIVGSTLGARLQRSAPVRELTIDEPPDQKPTVGNKIESGLRYGFGELFDHIAPWMLAGLALAALLEPLLDAEWVATLPGWLEVPLLAAIGLPAYVCASGATPVVAVLMHKGLSAGAGIAFLLTGPATNIVTFGVLSALHGRRAAFMFGLMMTGFAIVTGYAVNAWLEPTTFSLLEVASTAPTLLQQVALGLLGVMVVGSLFRQGPRGFIAQVITPHDESAEEDHAHAHAHGHGHGHGSAGHGHG